MGLMQAIYYRARDGSQPVRDFVHSLQPLAARVVVMVATAARPPARCSILPRVCS